MKRWIEYLRLLAIFWGFTMVINQICDSAVDPKFDDERAIAPQLEVTFTGESAFVYTPDDVAAIYYRGLAGVPLCVDDCELSRADLERKYAPKTAADLHAAGVQRAG